MGQARLYSSERRSMKFKRDGVATRINGIQPELVVAMLVVSGIHPDAEITSCVEGKHSRTSLHYVGYAIDVAINDKTREQAVDFRTAIAESLTVEYDVILEDDHIHIEFQPKGGR
jgi:hypothetical protein